MQKIVCFTIYGKTQTDAKDGHVACSVKLKESCIRSCCFLCRRRRRRRLAKDLYCQQLIRLQVVEENRPELLN